MGNHEVQGVCL